MLLSIRQKPIISKKNCIFHSLHRWYSLLFMATVDCRFKALVGAIGNTSLMSPSYNFVDPKFFESRELESKYRQSEFETQIFLKSQDGECS